MKTEKINLLIAEAFRNFGYEVTSNKDYVIFEPINLELTGIIQEENTISERSNFKTFIKLVLNCKSKSLNPIFEFTYGWGESKERSIIMGIERWLESDFPVIHDWLANHKIHDYCKELKIKSIDIETKEELYFNGIIGPLLNYNGSETIFDIENQMELFIILNNDLTTDFLDKKGVYPIKCFVSNDEYNNVQIDCRINGEIWERGHNTLYNYCEKNWKVENLIFWKQYFIIYHVDGFKDSKKLDKAAEEAVDKVIRRKTNENSEKWWKFWKK